MLRGEGISMLVPYRADGGPREENWNWLKQYWQYELPGAQIIEADDGLKPFSRAASINLAAQQATGDVFWLVDADFYMGAGYVLGTANEIRRDRSCSTHSWYHPAAEMVRIKKRIRDRYLRSDPEQPYQFPMPPKKRQYYRIENTVSEVMVTREAFEHVGGMDPRFRGWGGEEFALCMALGTLWGPAHTTRGALIHFWHPVTGAGSRFRPDWMGSRYQPRWEGQHKAKINRDLTGQYNRAWGKPHKMRRLIEQREYIEDNR